MTTANEARELSIPPRMRLSGPAQILQMIPFLIGFTPERSVVLVGTEAPRGTVVFTGRFDLDAPVELGEQWFIAAENAGVDRFLLAIYDERYVGKPLEHDDVVDSLRNLGSCHGIEMTDALAVNESKWWSYICHDQTCCPREGQQLVIDGHVATEAVANGLVARSSRADLVAELAPDEARAEAAQRLLHSLPRKDVREKAMLPGEGSVRLRRATAVKHFEQMQREFLASGQSCTAMQVAELGMAMADLTVRDCMMGSVPPGGDDDMLSFWRDVVRSSPEETVAGPATVYALCAYAAGDGARANVGLDRALDADPDYNMALLLMQAVAGGVPPRNLVPSLTRECQRIRAKVMRRGRRAAARRK